MDKDLQNRLQWLEDELFEEEDLLTESQDFDLDELLGEFLEGEPQNRAADFSRMAFGDEDFDESTAVLVARKKSKVPQDKPRKKGIKGLAVLAVLEVIAILAVLLRWALWFL